MDQLTGWIEAAFAASPAIFQGAFAVVAAASAVTALTPTPRDDVIVGRVYRIVELLALNVGRAKDSPPNLTGGRFVSR